MLQKQKTELLKLKKYMEEIKFGGLRLYWLKDENGKEKKYDSVCKKCGGKIIFGKRHNQFSKGFKITVDSILGLYCHLKAVFGLDFLMCSHCDQDFEESFIGRLRASGQNRKPKALQLLYRIKRFYFLPQYLNKIYLNYIFLKTFGIFYVLFVQNYFGQVQIFLG